MVKINQFQTLEEGLKILGDSIKKAPLSLRDVFYVLKGKGRCLLLAVLSIPFCQPIQIPGLSLPFGLLIAFIGLRMFFGRRVWLPKALLDKAIKKSLFEKISKKVLSFEHAIRSLIRPRCLWICHGAICEQLHGLVICILGILLSLPLPIPLSNLLAAWSILLIAIGILEDDGIFIIAGYAFASLTVVFFLYMLFSIKHVVQASF